MPFLIPANSENIVVVRYQLSIQNCLHSETSTQNFLVLYIIMAALCNYIFILWFLLFFPLPNLSGRRLDVYHTSTHGVALV